MKLQPIEQTNSDGLTVRGWRTNRRNLPLVVFLHGNGFCAGVYMPMHKYLAEHFDLLLLDLPGHGKSDALNPFAGWNNTAEIMHQVVSNNRPADDVPVYGLGHSLGGVLTLLNACRHGASYDSLVLLDPILFPGSMLFSMRTIGLLGLTSRVHPLVGPTLRRKKSWLDSGQALDYLRQRQIFKRWSEDSLASFVEHALQEDSNGGVELRCDPELEAHYFSSLPDGLWTSIKNLSCKTTILMGEESFPFAVRAAQTAKEKNKNITLEMVQGGHCFMQEQPEKIAGQIAGLLTKT